MKKRIPKFKNDQEAADFLEQDLSDYMDLDNITKLEFVYVPLDKTISIRLSNALLDKLKKLSKKMKIPYQRLMREILENGVNSLAKN